jgi:hypothetical protein
MGGTMIAPRGRPCVVCLWGVIGVGVGLTLVPPIIICPIWQWIATGYWLTFLCVYVLGFGGIALYTLVED